MEFNYTLDGSAYRLAFIFKSKIAVIDYHHQTRGDIGALYRVHHSEGIEWDPADERCIPYSVQQYFNRIVKNKAFL